MAMQSALSLASALKAPITIKIFVGDHQQQQQPYLVQKFLLEEASPYFRKALNGQFKEAREGILRFPEDDQKAWAVLFYYLFNRKIPIALAPHDFGPEGAGEYYGTLIKAWTLGDKYDIPAFQNAIVRQMMSALAVNSAPLKTMADVFESTPKDCSLRKLFAEEIVVSVLQFKTSRWVDFDSLAEFEGVQSLLLTCTQEYFEAMGHYPAHAYGGDEMEVRKYLVEEDRELKEKVDAMIKEMMGSST